jgi:arylsulfatase A-like enzyme
MTPSRLVRGCVGIAALAAALLTLVGCWSAPAGRGSARRPNILVLVADDQRWDQLSCADRPLIPELQTPNIDALARGGVLFRNAFVTTPICAVSRASIVTGRYARTHGMNRFNTPLTAEVLAASYPAVLRAHGYRTGVLGKWGMGTAGAETAFDVFDAWAGQGSYFHDVDGEKVHNAAWLAARAREFLGSGSPEQPFCLTVCFKSPHHPYQPDERDRRLFEDVDIPLRATDTPEAYAAMSSRVMEGSLNRWCYFDERKDAATRERFEKDFLRCVVSLDRAVGEILDALRALDLEDDTLVVYLSDNGYLWGEHGLGGKWLLYEESIRVPLIVRGPGVGDGLRGTKLDALALNIDVAPTILDVAGVPIPAEIDGRSLLPLLGGERVPWRQDFMMEHVGVVEVEHPIPDSLGLRSAAWKYIRYVGVQPAVEELYRVRDDPLEQHDLADEPACAGDLELLRSRLEGYLGGATR